MLFITCAGGLFLRGLVPALLGVPAVHPAVPAAHRAARAWLQVPHVLLAEGRRAGDHLQLLKRPIGFSSRHKPQNSILAGPHAR